MSYDDWKTRAHEDDVTYPREVAYCDAVIGWDWSDSNRDPQEPIECGKPRPCLDHDKAPHPPYPCNDCGGA